MEKEQQNIIITPPQKILFNTAYQLVKNGNNIMILPKKSPIKIPKINNNIHDINELVSFLKELQTRFSINMKTGGPLINNVGMILKSLSVYMSPGEIEYIRQEIFGDEKKKLEEEKQIKTFEAIIQNKYFKTFSNQEPNIYLRTQSSWETFKQKTFAVFIRENFCLNFDFKCTFRKKLVSDVLPSLDTFTIEDSVFRNIEYIYNGFTPNESNSWMWKQEKEYDRLGITGLMRSTIYKSFNKITASNFDHYWLPIVLNDSKKKIEIVNVNPDGFFEINDYDAKNIIALAPFEFATHQMKKTAPPGIDQSIFENSYLYNILKIIDKSLNDAMEKEFEIHDMKEFFDFKKI